MFYDPELIHEGIKYLLTLGVIVHIFVFALAMVLVGLYALYEDTRRRAGFDEVGFVFKMLFLLILGMWRLFVLLCDVARLPITFFLDKRRERVEAQYHAEEARRYAAEMQRVADIRSKEKRQADDIRRISRQYQSKADQLYAEFVNNMSNK